MRGTSRQIARVSPRRAVPLLAVVLLGAGCTSEPSAAEKSAASQQAKRTAIANADLREAVRTIKQCARDGDGEYPPAIRKQGGTITMLCGPLGRSIELSPGNRLTYRPKDGGFTVEITSPDGKVAYGTGPVPGSGAPTSS
jgi:hypothetical protein